MIDEELARPGELTQSLCSPWQNDYRSAACYYWAASRPDYVNVEPTASGASIGNNWLAREPRAEALRARLPTLSQLRGTVPRTGRALLRFVVGGRDHE